MNQSPLFSSHPDDSNDTTLHRADHFAMNCTWEICIGGEDAQRVQLIADELFEEIDRLENELSRFRPGSDVGQFNTLPAGTLQKLGVDTFHCLLLGLQLYEASGGAFDVARGTGLTQIEIYTDSYSVRKRLPETQLDFGGIGKGYALDQLVELLAEWELGSGIAHCGQSSVSVFGSPRTLGIRHPRDPQRELGRIHLDSQTLSGSSNALYGDHIVDPTDGRVAHQALASWCVAPTAATSDALATCGLLLDANALEELCQQHPDIALLRASEHDGDLELTRFGAFPDFAPQ